MIRLAKNVCSFRLPVLGLVALAIAGFAAGCAGPNLVNLWKDPEYPRAPLKNLLVVALRNDPGRRRIAEDALVSALEERGVTATPSYRLFKDALPDTQQVRDVVVANGYDGVVVAHKLETETATRYVPGYVTTTPVTYRNPWSGFYYTYYKEVRQPGYTETEKIVRYQVDVWSTDEHGTMVWTGTTESFNPSSIREVTGHISKLVVPELARQGVIAATR